MKTYGEIRHSFLDYFRQQGHKIVPSSSLIPANDPTLLFTNAGMVQFKDIFLGHAQCKDRRIASSQRCVRAGGKHNDLENVGYTTRHHTFFEMLGNFSFGDYFKEEAIHFAWDYLTNILCIPEQRLWITVYKDDNEAAAIWLDKIGVSSERFSYCSDKDNFWSMGDTGPCGPCSEIFYDHGQTIAGSPPGQDDTQRGERYIEIWNLVFTQYNRDEKGRLHPIPSPSVDTGMGLERIAAVIQGVHSNYDIDLFCALASYLQRLADRTELDLISTRVIIDHIRSCSFLISDGVTPSNEGRGYVLRKIIRRAIRHGHKLGFTEPFFYKLVTALAQQMQEAYPELEKNRARIEQILLNEERRFVETLGQGLKRIEDVIANLDGDTLPGEQVFRLYDTYGFPIELTADIARECGLTIDQHGFDKAMDEQRQRALSAAKSDAFTTTSNGLVSEFSGYHQLTQETKVLGLHRDGQEVTVLESGNNGVVVLAETPFYAQMGGQLGDQGKLIGKDSLFAVSDTRKQGRAYLHLGILRAGILHVGDVITANVDAKNRIDITRNHSATHLLHAALRRVLGPHVTQRGSLVAADRLRFDFTHTEPVSDARLREIEHLVNTQILSNAETITKEMPLEKARQSGAILLASEKYDDIVRTISIGDDFSKELCGGTHVARAGDIGLFKIISESGIAADTRRIEAITGSAAMAWVKDSDAQLKEIAALLRVDVKEIAGKLMQQLARLQKQEKEIAQFRTLFVSESSDDMAACAVMINGIKVLANTLNNVDPKTLRDMVDQLKNKLNSAALVLASVSEDNRVNLVAGVTKDNVARINAKELVNFVAEKVGGRGGGRPDLAQAGGNNPATLEQALAAVPTWVRTKLESS